MHVDHLGSVDALTDEDGTVVERRSYDPFGQRQKPDLGAAAAGVVREQDDAGVHRARERRRARAREHEGPDVRSEARAVLDDGPHRFEAALRAELESVFSYVLNNPLNYVDPSGFQEEDEKGYASAPMKVFIVEYPDGNLGFLGILQPFDEEPAEGQDVAAESGAAAPPTDVGTTGNSSGYVPQPVTTAPEDWVKNPYVQIEGGFLAGLALGFVPLGGTGRQFLDDARVLTHGSPQARLGLAVGEIVGGIALLVGGATGEVLGGVASVTTIGAALGVPAMVVSTGLVVSGLANIADGIRGLTQVLMSTGSGSGNGGARSPETTAPGAAGGPRAGKPFTPAMKREAWKANEVKHGGQATCENCKQPMAPAERSASGVRPPANEGQLDHVIPRTKDGNGSLENGQYLCRTCNRAKSDKRSMNGWATRRNGQGVLLA